LTSSHVSDYLSEDVSAKTKAEKEDRRHMRGFASMSPEQRSIIASKGGKAAHEQGSGHEFTSEEARAAGKKGGKIVSKNRQHMAAIGRVGGRTRGENLRKAADDGSEAAEGE
jgi:uncharacterized protein